MEDGPVECRRPFDAADGRDRRIVSIDRDGVRPVQDCLRQRLAAAGRAARETGAAGEDVVVEGRVRKIAGVGFVADAGDIAVRHRRVGAVEEVAQAVDGAEIGEHPAREPELSGRDGVEQEVVAAGVRVEARVRLADAAVRAHDRPGMPVFDAPFERLQLELVEHPLVQHDGGVRARVLEVVHRQVLERHDQPLALDAARLVSNELAGEERVLAEGLEVASRGDERDLVDHRRIENVLIRRTTLAADHDAVGIRRSPLEGGGQAHGRGQARLLVAEPHTGRTVRLPKRRDAQTLHAIVDPGLADATGDERSARRTRVDHRERVRLTRVPTAELRIRHLGLTMHEPDLLRQRQPPDQTAEVRLRQCSASGADRWSAEAAGGHLRQRGSRWREDDRGGNRDGGRRGEQSTATDSGHGNPPSHERASQNAEFLALAIRARPIRNMDAFSRSGTARSFRLASEQGLGGRA